METLEQVITEAVNRAFREKMEKKETQIEEAPKEKKVREKIKGIRALASYIGSCPSTAQKLKNSGKIPYSQYGNRVIFYSDEVDFALRVVMGKKENF